MTAAAQAWSAGVPWAEALEIAEAAISKACPKPKAFPKRQAKAKAKARSSWHCKFLSQYSTGFTWFSLTISSFGRACVLSDCGSHYQTLEISIAGPNPSPSHYFFNFWHGVKSNLGFDTKCFFCSVLNGWHWIDVCWFVWNLAVGVVLEVRFDTNSSFDIRTTWCLKGTLQRVICQPSKIFFRIQSVWLGCHLTLRMAFCKNNKVLQP